ncbi:MAG: ThiF family adenylyltransferase, partial [Nanoarchaeota archaeon]|nr:ThiF family adenylyltransferase [Nanoarchaeota archaeon]
MYEELVSRNFPLLSAEEQKNLRRLHVGIAGCGMGSFIAEALCRVGVEKFLFADPDIVEMANLNHQAYGVKDVGKNKAVALSNHILNINPEAIIETWADFVTQNNALDFASRVDVVIDCIDPMPGIAVSLALARV